jgi:hypothetical protein
MAWEDFVLSGTLSGQVSWRTLGEVKSEAEGGAVGEERRSPGGPWTAVGEHPSQAGGEETVCVAMSSFSVPLGSGYLFLPVYVALFGG